MPFAVIYIMSHSNVRIWVHAVFATKYREAQIFPSVEVQIHQFLFQQLVEHGCFVECINGMPDHIHMLFLLSPKKALADVIGFVKGGTSHRINQSGMLPHKFAWQVGYSAFSVSESKISTVRLYIERQKVHHLGLNFAEEIEWLERLHGIIPDSKEQGQPKENSEIPTISPAASPPASSQTLP